MKSLIIIFLSCLLLFCCCGYKEMTRGKFDRAEYINGGFMTSGKTIIYFEDGQSVVLFAAVNIIHFKKGDCIVVSQFSTGGPNYRIEGCSYETND